jgi:hypothetical protein
MLKFRMAVNITQTLNYMAPIDHKIITRTK